MKRSIYRNIAIVTAVFIASLSVMLITNYFQVSDTSPLQLEVVETLKLLNDEHSDNPALQEQIRQLDLLARKAYFIRLDHLLAGVYILLGMLAVFVVCLRFYFANDKNIPDKEIDPIDEWMIKTHSRRYITWGTVAITSVALLFVVLSSPFLQTKESSQATEAATAQAATDEEAPLLAETAEVAPESAEATAEADTATTLPAATDASPAAETAAPQPAVSKVTHNGFRGNNSNGISAAKGLPAKWDLAAGSHIAWKKAIPRKGYNSPVVNGNNVFFTGADNEARELYCYDLTTGEQRWSLAAANIPGSPSVLPKVTDDTGLAASTVTTNGRHVYAIFASGDVMCADMDGKRVWAKNLGVPDNHYGFASSLLIHGNLLIVQYDNNTSPKLIALDVATGAERWSKNRPEKTTWSSPIIAQVGNTPQLILMGNPAITAYNPNSGEQLWRVVCLSGEVGTSPCSSGGVVYGASEYAKLVAVDGASGNVLWESSDYLPEVSSPVATKDNVFLATSYGVVAAFDAKTGALRKEHELNTEFYSSPVVADGKLYLFSNSGKMHIFTADNDFRLLDSFETGEKTFATPAFTDGKIVVRTEKSIYCVTTN